MMLTSFASSGFTAPGFDMWKALRHKTASQDQKVHNNPSSTQAQKEETTKIRREVWESTKPQAELDKTIREAGHQLGFGIAAAIVTITNAFHWVGSWGTTLPATLGLAAAQFIGVKRFVQATVNTVGTFLLRATRENHVGDFVDGLVDMRYDPRKIPHADKFQVKDPDRAAHAYDRYRENPSGSDPLAAYYRRAQHELNSQ